MALVEVLAPIEDDRDRMLEYDSDQRVWSMGARDWVALIDEGSFPSLTSSCMTVSDVIPMPTAGSSSSDATWICPNSPEAWAPLELAYAEDRADEEPADERAGTLLK